MPFTRKHNICASNGSQKQIGFISLHCKICVIFCQLNKCGLIVCEIKVKDNRGKSRAAGVFLAELCNNYAF